MSDKQLDKDVKIYIKEVKSLLICDYKTQKKFIGDIKSRIDEHIESGCVKNIDDIYKQIGTPQDIAKAFFENADVKKSKKENEYFKNHSHRNNSRVGNLVVCIVRCGAPSLC